ncbi:uncharacterized protein LOC133530635 [Cydia pomonella]|uniref:uncharacterized protein LOC133530635 n=1 Tax=Cydia pomonella TaxID=82600 RepID=UPI002ADDCABC|nr:uncharacterized protein LOC133530635 [Cydia pomonella]
MEEKNNRLCVICDQYLDIGVVVVKERGLLKFIESSIARGDGKQDYFKNRTEIKIHKNCRNSYNNQKCIDAAIKRNKKVSENRSESTEFDFQNKCLFCDKDASILFEEQQARYPESNRVAVGQVETFETQNAILQACTINADYWSQLVLLRIGQLNILEKNARYHYDCYNIFCHALQAPGLEQGHHESESNEVAMDQDLNMTESSDHSIKMEPDDPDEVNVELEHPVKQEPDPEAPQNTLNVSDPLRTSDSSKPEPVTPLRNQVCRICNCALTQDITIVKYKGYLTLQRSSELRQDGRFPPGTEHELIEVPLHTACRKKYSREGSIRKSICMRVQREMDANAPTLDGNKVRRLTQA